MEKQAHIGKGADATGKEGDVFYLWQRLSVSATQ